MENQKNESNVLVKKNLSVKSRCSENNLVSILLQSLYKNGVREIIEEELSKKLYSYYHDEKYRELFSDIAKDRYEDKVDISNAMSLNKWCSGCIGWVSNNSELLYLYYSDEIDFSYYEEKVGKDVVELICEIANKLAVTYKIEKASAKKLNIYSFNPNKSYTILRGTRGKINPEIYDWELITDGNIKQINTIPYIKDLCFADPSDSHCLKGFDKYSARHIELEDASYSIMQGKYNDEIRRLEVYTSLDDLDKLKQISEYANQVHNDTSTLLVEEHPFVRKLSLK